MTIQVNAFPTYTAKGNREDLTDRIFDTSPTTTPFISAVPRVKAKATNHEWQTDVLATAVSTNAQLEGDVVAGQATVATVRLGNYCQISSKDAVITGTQEAVEKAGRRSEMSYQLARRSQELKRDMEMVVTSNQRGVAGATGTARKLRGLEAFLVTNVNRHTTATAGGTKGKSATAPNSATGAATDATQMKAFTEAKLKAMLQLLFTNGGTTKTLMMGPHTKTVFSAMVGRAASQQWVSNNTVNATVDIYKSDFGNLKAVINLFSRDRSAIAFDPEYAALAFLRPIFTTALAKTGDTTRRDIRCEYTLELRNEKAHGIVADVNLTS